MQVSDYLRPVLDAALEHAPTVDVFADTAVNVTVRARLAAERKTALDAAWAEAVELAAAAEAIPVESEWAAWRRQGEQTAAYRKWRSTAVIRSELTSTRLAILYYDTVLTDTTAPVIRHPDAINTDLKAVVTDLANPTARPAGLAGLAVFASSRLRDGLAETTDELAYWELWRRDGGDRRPEFLDWRSRRRRRPTAAAVAPVGVAVSPPSPPTAFDALRPGVLIPPLPDPADIVTGMRLRYRVIAYTPLIRAAPQEVNYRDNGGQQWVPTGVAGSRGYKFCVYYTSGTDTIVSVYRPTLIIDPCPAAPAGQELVRSFGVGGNFQWVTRETPPHRLWVRPRVTRREPMPYDAVNVTETIPYDGSRAAFNRINALMVAGQSNSAGLIEAAWVNAVGESPDTTVQFAASPPPEKFGRPGWLSVAVDDAATPRVQQVGVFAAVQYAPVPNNAQASSARQAVTLVLTEQRTGGTAWETIAAISRTAPAIHVVVPSAVLARGNPFKAFYRDGSATLLAAAQALPLLAEFDLPAATQPFYIHT